MKRTPGFLGIMLLITSLGHAQTGNDTTQPATYLFDHFIDGAVRLKNGNIEQALLNYDSENQSIVFKKNRQNLVLTDLENIDTVYIQEKKFVPAEDKFYQVGTFTPIALLISYSNKMHPLTATTDHNGTSQQSSDHVNNTVSEAYLNRRFQPHYSVEIIRRYWLRNGHTFYKANNEKEVARVFPAKREVIDDFIKNNKIEFGREKDMIDLVVFCNE